MDIVNQEDIRELLKIDMIFESIFKKYGEPPNWNRPPGFISLTKIILEQQVSLASANAHFLKLSNYLNGFTPSNILKLSEEEFRMCHISRQKAGYLLALSAEIVEGNLDLEALPVCEDDEVRNRLTSIKGIGNWTADIYLMFCLQSKNIFPEGDIAIVNTVKELTEARTKEEILFVAQKWEPFKTLAAYFLWHYYLNKKIKKQQNSDH